MIHIRQTSKMLTQHVDDQYASSIFFRPARALLPVLASPKVLIKKQRTGIEPVTIRAAIERSTTELPLHLL